MIQGKTPEITIKFNSLPELPTEGKKVTLEILAENGIKVKAELNRKTLKKRTARALGFRARKDGASNR